MLEFNTMSFDKLDTTGGVAESIDRVDSHIKENEESYWSNFYERNDFSEGSSFYEFINNLPELPEVVIDIGCGQGRDSFAFAQSGKQVIGLDRSDIGVRNANSKAIHESLDSHLSFAVCDVSNRQNLSDMITVARERAEGDDVVFYMRFFLHSIPDETQNSMMEIIASQAKPGDVFAAEFRTDKDIDTNRVFGDSHYRKYQNAEEFSTKLENIYGWNAIYEIESNGLSPYGDEDPVLYRVVAIK